MAYLDIDPAICEHLHDKNELDLMFEIAREGKIAMGIGEILSLYRLAKRTAHLPGAIAEVGVYRGGSAKMMGIASAQKKAIYLFDTFEGIPQATAGVDHVLVGQFANSLENVKNYLSEFSCFKFHPGVFPESAVFLNDSSETFSMVNLDTDIYSGTLSGLNFFYPRMDPHGVIVVHDYNSKSCPGVRKAVDEFAANIPETLIDLWSTQALICKSK
ncbi:MAG: hypothetical protein JWQ35_215 [Bacteriovoracaceae bacterium]|nr:hypothetical protein [Bacteriovoracaceae bacterium]